MSEINPGQVVRITNGTGFMTSGGVLTDPTTVTFRWSVNGVETVWLVAVNQVVKDNTGLYHADLGPVVAGTYSYRWEGVGALIATAEGQFTVTTAYPYTAGASIGAYADLPTFRAYLRAGGAPINSTAIDSADNDTPLEVLALEAAARAIDDACGRTFNTAAATVSKRYFAPRWTRDGWFSRLICDIDDVANAAGMIVNADATGNGSYTNTLTTYRVGPKDNPAKGFPYSHLTFDLGVVTPFYDSESLEVQALWGWSVTPATIVNANLLQAARYLKRRDAPFGIVESVGGTTQTRLLPGLDRDVAQMLSKYQRVFVV